MKARHAMLIRAGLLDGRRARGMTVQEFNDLLDSSYAGPSLRRRAFNRQIERNQEQSLVDAWSALADLFEVAIDNKVQLRASKEREVQLLTELRDFESGQDT